MHLAIGLLLDLDHFSPFLTLTIQALPVLLLSDDRNLEDLDNASIFSYIGSYTLAASCDSRIFARAFTWEVLFTSGLPGDRSDLPDHF